MVNVRMVPTGRTQRVRRRPKHSWQVRHQPWQIQPMVIAPVLPGDTLVSLQWQARVVSDPIVNPLIGWWYETMFFYVRISDLETTPGELTEMFVNPGADMSAFNAAAAAHYYHYGSTIDWTGRCLARIVDMFFRNEEEIGTDFKIGNLPIASVGTEGTWLQSFGVTGDVTDVNVDANADSTITAEEVQDALTKWTQLRQAGLTKMTYEDFLGTYGVKVPAAELNKPELIRFNRAWAYPANTIDPADGSPSSAMSWSIQERADKHRFCREPGFIVGVSIARPKVYRKNQSGSAVGLMTSALHWLPAQLRDDWAASVVDVAETAAGPLTGQAGAYSFDLKDLLLYGDQFINFATSATDAGLVALPTAAGGTRYASAADADALFVGGSADPKVNLVRADGICQLQILGAQTDTTP